MMNVDERLALAGAIASLSSSERRVVIGIYILGLKQADVAREIGFSTRHVRRLQQRALTALKHTLIEYQGNS